ncbi:MAG: SGNH/GDSL hydrolase family protein [Acidimicrobiales bacterium]
MRFAAAASIAMAAFTGLSLEATAASASTLPSYSALGDSYAAGVGTNNYYPSSGSCDRSPQAYAPIIASSKGYSLDFQACGGATTSQVINTQLGGLSSSTSLVTVSAGGNNIGFANVLQTCAEYGYINFWGYDPCQSAINSAEYNISHGLAQSLSALYSAIASRAPHAHVDVVGYPRLFDPNGDTCPFGGSLFITHNEALQMNQGANQLDAVIQNEAAAYGFTFVDPRAAFAWHSVCDSNPWINGVSYPISDSFHPDAAGYQALVGIIENAGL